MDVFSFRDQLVGDYERFSRSFTTIRAADIQEGVEAAYRSGRFWPAPLIQLNPNFVPGGPIEALVAGGLLDPECAEFEVMEITGHTSLATLREYLRAGRLWNNTARAKLDL